MEILVICLILAIISTFFTDMIVNIIDKYQTYKQKQNYIRERRKKWNLV